MLHDTGPHPIIEQHLPLFEPVFEMNIDDRGRERVTNLGQDQVVRGHEADGAQPDQSANDTFGTHAAVVRVGPVKKLVEQEKERQWRTRQVDHLGTRVISA